jgi:hypothetical protein
MLSKEGICSPRHILFEERICSVKRGYSVDISSLKRIGDMLLDISSLKRICSVKRGYAPQWTYPL